MLDFSENRMSDLPADISKLTNLNEIIGSNNQISSLTAGMCELTKLRQLSLANNRWEWKLFVALFTKSYDIIEYFQT